MQGGGGRTCGPQLRPSFLSSSISVACVQGKGEKVVRLGAGNMALLLDLQSVFAAHGAQ